MKKVLYIADNYNSWRMKSINEESIYLVEYFYWSAAQAPAKAN